MIFLSKWLTEQMISNKIILEQDKETYEYGLQITFANFFNACIVVGIGFFLCSINEAILFYLLFVGLRIYCGGYHANTYGRCFTTFGCISFFA